MAFVAEDGTAKSDATAYCTTAFVDSYFADQGGHTVWDAKSSTEKEQAIVKATRYIDQRFHSQFLSQKKTRTQALQWPRDEIYFADGSLRIASTEVPIELQRACAEYAARAANSDLITDPTNSRETEEERKTVGPITTNKRFRTRGRKSALVGNHAFSEYPSADLSIEPLLRSGQSHELQRV